MASGGSSGSIATGSGVIVTDSSNVVPEMITFFTNCDCCEEPEPYCACKKPPSGVGPQTDGFFKACEGFPIWEDCKRDFVASINLDFSQCSNGFGSCGSGSNGFDFTGSEATSGSGSCLGSCPSCCDLIPRSLEFNLKCQCLPFDKYLMDIGLLYADCYLSSVNLFDPDEKCVYQNPYLIENCRNFRFDKCNYFILHSSGFLRMYFNVEDANILGTNMPFGVIPMEAMQITSCDPLVMTGNIRLFENIGGFRRMKCIYECGGISCITGTVTITEALP